MDKLKLIKTMQVEFRIKVMSTMHKAEFRRIRRSVGMKIKHKTVIINRPKVATSRLSNSVRRILLNIKEGLTVLIRG